MQKTTSQHMAEMLIIKKKVYGELIKHDLLTDYQDCVRPVINRSKYKKLFELLDQTFFFEFHASNHSRQIVTVYQITNFFKRKNGGWWLVLQGVIAQKDQLENHHINSNPADSHEDNLVYLEAYDHDKITFISEIAFNDEPEAKKLAKALFSGETLRIALLTITKSLEFWEKSSKIDEKFPEIEFTDLVMEPFEDYKFIDGIAHIFCHISKRVAKVIKTRRNHTVFYHFGLSAKQMLKNLSKYGFTHKTYTPGYLNVKES